MREQKSIRRKCKIDLTGIIFRRTENPRQKFFVPLKQEDQMFNSSSGSTDTEHSPSVSTKPKSKLTPEQKARAKRLLTLAATAKPKRMKLANLKTDTVNYQCVLDDKRVQAIVENFFEPAANPIIVAHRIEDGISVYYIVNGQHTRAALMIKGFTAWDCVVLDEKGISIEDEALAFLVLNDKTTHIAPTLRKGFPARVTAGERKAVALKAILDETKTPLSGKSPAVISSLPVLFACFDYDEGVSLKRAIYLAKRAYPGLKVPGGILHAIAGILYGSDGGIDEVRLVATLQKCSPLQWANNVKDACNGAKPYTILMPHYYAGVFLAAYNVSLSFKTGKRVSAEIANDKTIFKQPNWPGKKK